jgi:hypothetical protein
MPKKIPLFTADQLSCFAKEIKEAGSTDLLMLQKEALTQNGESTMIASYKDMEEYKQKYLTGVYESLRPYYSTVVPYVFWSFLYDALVKSGVKPI